MTKVALAEAVGLTPRRIAAFENEGEVPPPPTLDAMATVLDFPPAFFTRPAREAVEPERVSLRSFSRLSAASRNAALASVALGAEIAHWMEERFELPAVNLPDLRDVEPREAAAALRTMWGLGEMPAPNMIHMLEAHGVRVFSLADEFSALDALSAWIDDRPFVFLTVHKSPERARWDAAHELGHLVLHLGMPPQGRVIEREADEFASEFLLPARGVRSRASRSSSLHDVREHKLFWKVSALAYIRRLHQLDRLTDWQYKSLIIEASQAGYRRSEGEIEREDSQLIPKVLHALRMENMSLSAISDDLSISNGELRGLIFSPLATIEGGRQPTTGGSRPTLYLITEP